MTRRTRGLEKVNECPDEWIKDSFKLKTDSFIDARKMRIKMSYVFKNSKQETVECKPYYQNWDRIWVKETYQHTSIFNLNSEDENYGYVYKADDQPWKDYENWKWKPSLFMPKKAARIWLVCTGFRVERLHDISESDAVNEGVLKDKYETYFNYINKEYNHISARNSFCTLWDSINGRKNTDLNPWVFVYSFIKIEK